MPTATVVPASVERPLEEKPDLPMWSENYLFQAYAPEIDLGFWTHLGVPVYDFGLWHDITLVYMPGGEELLLAKGYGSRNGTADVSGSMVSADYDEARAEWVVRFHGAAQRANRQMLEWDAAVDGRAEPFACELRYTGMSQVWDLNEKVAGQSWSNAHIEQPCLVSGWAEWAGKRHRFEGAGVRDHSRGPRDFAHMGSYHFLHGEFPSGRAFGLIHVEPTEGQARELSSAYLVEDGALVDASVVSLPGDRGWLDPLELVLSGPDGEQSISGELVHGVTFSLEYPNDVLFGYRPGNPQHRVREGQVRWNWDGETGYGLGERGVRVAADGLRDAR
jgi:hypothetical protein